MVLPHTHGGRDYTDVNTRDISYFICFKEKLFIYLGCAGSSLHRVKFSLVAAYGLSCPVACRILVPNQGSNLSPALKSDSLSLDHQGSPWHIFWCCTVSLGFGSRIPKSSICPSLQDSTKHFAKCWYSLCSLRLWSFPVRVHALNTPSSLFVQRGF